MASPKLSRPYWPMTHGRSWRASPAEEDRTGPGTEVAIILACADDRSVTEVSAELGHFPDGGGQVAWRFVRCFVPRLFG